MSAMAESNADLARRAFEAMRRGGVSAALEFMDPEIEFEPPEEALEGHGPYRGHQAVRERWNLILEPFDEVEVEFEEFLEAPDDKVVVVFRVHGRGKSSGAPVNMRQAHVVTLRGARAVRLKAFRDPAAAKRAAGLACGDGPG
jgi:ketosteroid isomerase-like protein